MTIHWKVIEEHILMVPLVPWFNPSRGTNAFSENPQSLKGQTVARQFPSYCTDGEYMFASPLYHTLILPN
jgi:hypothetical protein